MNVDVATYRRAVIELSRLLPTLPLTQEANTSTICECQGLLAYLGGRWQHVEACIDCYDREVACTDTHRHIACPDPRPRTCTHGGCTEEVSLVIECAYGLAKRTCCGCCWDLTDSREGRVLWPR